jgi:hypothetical protein
MERLGRARPNCMNQHSPVGPPVSAARNASTTAPAGISGVPASASAGRGGSTIGVSLKPGQCALTRGGGRGHAVHIGHHDPGADLGQPLRDRAADPARPAGHQRD